MARTDVPIPASRADLGARAEALATDYLARQGLVLVARNFRTRRGEIDVIVRDRDTLVFVEVRLRSQAAFGGAGASITPAKRARLLAAASRLYFVADDGKLRSWPNWTDEELKAFVEETHRLGKRIAAHAKSQGHTIIGWKVDLDEVGQGEPPGSPATAGAA